MRPLSTGTDAYSLDAREALLSVRDKWWFIMMSPEALLLILDEVAEAPRLKLTLRVLARCLRHMDRDGRVRITRKEIAEDLGTSDTAVSLALKTLRESGVIVSEHDRKRDVHMTIRVNSNLATQLVEPERSHRQAKDPQVGRQLAAA